MDKPLVSVCIPAYNNELFIKDAIQSVIDQTYGNWELIISDDASKDHTLDIIRSFGDKRITVIENRVNLGLGGNWNKVVKEAKGTYVKLLCGDDLIAPDCLEKQVAVFTADTSNAIALVTSHRHLVDEEGKVMVARKFPFKSGLIASQSAISLNFLFGTNVIGEPAVGLYRRSVLNETGFYNATNSYLIDLDFWLKVLLTGKLYVIPEVLASFRISKSAMSTQLKKDQAKLYGEFAKKIYEDKRFKLNLFQYYFACAIASLMQVLRRVFVFFYMR